MSAINKYFPEIKLSKPKNNMMAIWCSTPEGIIGCGSYIPWYSKMDFKFFQHMTSDSICIFGRTTYDSLSKKDLGHNRKVFVLDNKLLYPFSVLDLTSEVKPKNLSDIHLAFSNIASMSEKLNSSYYGQASICGGASIYKVMIIENNPAMIFANTFMNPVYLPEDKPKVSIKDTLDSLPSNGYIPVPGVRFLLDEDIMTGVYVNPETCTSSFFYQMINKYMSFKEEYFNSGNTFFGVRQELSDWFDSIKKD